MTNGDDDLGRKTVLTFGTEVAAEHRSHRSTVDAAEHRSRRSTVDAADHRSRTVTKLTSPELKTA